MVSVYVYLGLLALLFALFGYFLHSFAYRNSSMRRLSEEIERLRARIPANDRLAPPLEEPDASAALAGLIDEKWDALKQELDRLEQRISNQEQRSVPPAADTAPGGEAGPSQESARRETLENILKSLDRIEEELRRLPLQSGDEVSSRP